MATYKVPSVAGRHLSALPVCSSRGRIFRLALRNIFLAGFLAGTLPNLNSQTALPTTPPQVYVLHGNEIVPLTTSEAVAIQLPRLSLSGPKSAATAGPAAFKQGASHLRITHGSSPLPAMLNIKNVKPLPVTRGAAPVVQASSMAQPSGVSVHSVLFDYTGDGRADMSWFDYSSGTWTISPMGNAAAWYQVSGFFPDTIPAPADFDGDGKADMSYFRPSTGVWTVSPSANPAGWWTVSGFPADTIPEPADYTGDGKADMAWFVPSQGTWTVSPMGNPAAWYQMSGFASDIVPLPADYDGDGKTDVAYYDRNTKGWTFSPSSNPAGWWTTSNFDGSNIGIIFPGWLQMGSYRFPSKEYVWFNGKVVAIENATVDNRYFGN